VDRKFLRPGWIVGHLLVVLAVLVCLRLGRWQWDRMHHGGTLQNFGYAVLWPVFGAAFVYMWFRFLQLEKLKDAEDDAELAALAAGARGGGADVPPTPAGVPPVGEPNLAAPADLASGPSRSGRALAGGETVDEASPTVDDAVDANPAPPTGRSARTSRSTPSTGVTVGVATVGGANEDDPELAAYNRALAALAEKDHRRAR
jgi:hypothetical protein